jgi:hypothetical protein
MQCLFQAAVNPVYCVCWQNGLGRINTKRYDHYNVPVGTMDQAESILEVKSSILCLLAELIMQNQY